MQVTERFQQHRIPGPKPYYSTNERPDVWFAPTEVWELRGADLTLSAVHKAAFGLIHDSRGVSLRHAHPLNAAKGASGGSHAKVSRRRRAVVPFIQLQM